MSFLGIDIGSSQIKAVAFASDGRRLASAYRKYNYATPQPGYMELDSREVLEAAREVIAECAERTRAVSPIRAMAASSQGEAFTPLDARGKILGPAMISGDIRATAIIEEWVKGFGKEKLYRITGHTASAMFSLAKLLWLRKNRPELYANAALFLCYEDLLAHHLTGRAVMSWPEAGRTLLFDLNTHDWNPELLDAVGLTPGRLSKPAPAGAAVGALLPHIASELGLEPGVLWVTAGHDQVVGALGCGATEPGTAMYAAGSVECVVPVQRQKILTSELRDANLCTYDFVLPDRYASLAYSLTGSNLLEYFRREIVRPEHGSYEELLAEMPQEPTPLFVLSYFTASGTPFFDAHTPACVYGWRFDTTRGTLLKGLLEGVALEMKLNFEYLQRNGLIMQKLIASGGGFRSPAVVQLHADVLNLPISVAQEPENGCRGAAMLAQRGLEGGISIPAPDIQSQVVPNPDRAAHYAQKFAQWKLFSEQIRRLRLDA